MQVNLLEADNRLSSLIVSEHHRDPFDRLLITQV